MTPAAVPGRNRTGVSVAPALARRMLEATEEFPPSSNGSADALADVRAEYASAAEPIGTMPATPSERGDDVSQLLLDKLAERLAFERAGTRLYEALLSKFDAGTTFRGGPNREDIVHIRDEEHRHVTILIEIIRALGGDPTVVSPSADVQAVAGKGLAAVLCDPRTDVLQCLEALLVAELVDNDCWTALLEFAETAGDADMVEQCTIALEREGEHLDMVRAWVAAGTGRSVERARAMRARPEPVTAGRTSKTSRGRVQRKGARASSTRSRLRTSAKKRKRSTR